MNSYGMFKNKNKKFIDIDKNYNNLLLSIFKYKYINHIIDRITSKAHTLNVRKDI